MQSAVSTDRPRSAGAVFAGDQAGQFVFVSGQVPSIQQPARWFRAASALKPRALQNLARSSAGGTSFQQVVRTTVYLADLADFAAMNEVYATFFTVPQPARSTIQAARLPRDARIEIDVIAFLG